MGIEILPRWLRRSQGIRRRGSAWVAASALFLLLAGCATTKTEFVEILWPEPPLTPRIKSVGILRNEFDLERSGESLFVEAVLGKKEKRPRSLRQPMAVAPSRDGTRLYVTDYQGGTVFVFDLEARRVWFLGEPTVRFARPFGVAVDERDNVYVVDSTEKVIRVFDRSGKFLRNITHESLDRPTGIAIDLIGRRIYVVDTSGKGKENHVVHVFDIEGTYIKALGTKGAKDGQFLFPTYVAVDGEGKVYVTDTLNARVQVFDREGRHLMNIGRRGDGVGMFDKPKGVAVDTFGNVYVVDSNWSAVQIFNQRGQVLLFFGGRGRYPGQLFNPNGIAIDKDNRIYVADAFNARVGIYQLINTTAEDSFLPLPKEGGDAPKTGEREAVKKTEKEKLVEKPVNTK